MNLSHFGALVVFSLLVSVVFVLVNFVIDMLYAVFDPRIRYR